MEYRVKKQKLENPVCIKTIQEKTLGGEAKARQAAEQTIEYLKHLRVKFAVEGRDSAIEIFIEENSLQEE